MVNIFNKVKDKAKSTVLLVALSASLLLGGCAPALNQNPSPTPVVVENIDPAKTTPEKSKDNICHGVELAVAESRYGYTTSSKWNADGGKQIKATAYHVLDLQENHRIVLDGPYDLRNAVFIVFGLPPEYHDKYYTCLMRSKGLHTFKKETPLYLLGSSNEIEIYAYPVDFGNIDTGKIVKKGNKILFPVKTMKDLKEAKNYAIGPGDSGAPVYYVDNHGNPHILGVLVFTVTDGKNSFVFYSLNKASIPYDVVDINSSLSEFKALDPIVVNQNLIKIQQKYPGHAIGLAIAGNKPFTYRRP